jgi:hypothetical protein
VRRMMAHGTSERRACRLTGIDRKTLHYVRHTPADETALPAAYRRTWEEAVPTTAPMTG